MTFLARTLRAIDEVPEAAWNALVGPDAPPFLDWRWLHAMEAAGCVGADAGWYPCHLTLWRGADLWAAAPAYVKLNSMGEFVFDHAWEDLARRVGVEYYPKLVVAVPFTPATGRRILCPPGEDRAALAAAMGALARRVCEQLGLSSVHALFVEPDEVAALGEVGFTERLGLQFHWHNRGFSSMADFLALVSSKKRNQLKREMAEPARSGVTIETVRGDRLDDALMKQVYRFYLSTVDRFMWGHRYLTERFFHAVGATLRDHVEVVMARDSAAGGRPIAAAFNLAKGDRLYGRYWGCREERRFLHFNVCYYHSIADCIERGIATFEPGAGGEHKLARGFEPTITHSAHWLRDERLAEPIRRYLPNEAAQVRRRAEILAEECPLRPPAP